MSKFLSTTILTACALGLGLTAGSLATASYSPDAELLEAAYEVEPVEMVAPVLTNEIFAEQAAACTKTDEVLYQIGVDQMQIGGEVIKLSDARYQSFSDAWRKEAGMKSTQVSGIVGHVYFDESVGDWMVDVTEFDPAGCAESRTIISAKQWNYLIKAAAAA
jgi:hypothetical protein